MVPIFIDDKSRTIGDIDKEVFAKGRGVLLSLVSSTVTIVITVTTTNVKVGGSAVEGKENMQDILDAGSA